MISLLFPLLLNNCDKTKKKGKQILHLSHLVKLTLAVKMVNFSNNFQNYRVESISNKNEYTIY